MRALLDVIVSDQVARDAACDTVRPQPARVLKRRGLDQSQPLGYRYCPADPAFRDRGVINFLQFRLIMIR